MTRKRPAPSGATKRQVNVRLDGEAVSILEAIQFLEGSGSLQEVVGPLIENFARNWAQDPAVRDLLDQRVRYQQQAFPLDETE